MLLSSLENQSVCIIIVLLFSVYKGQVLGIGLSFFKPFGDAAGASSNGKCACYMVKLMKYKKWAIFATIMTVLMLICEAYAVVMLNLLNMVPTKLFITGVVFLIFFTVITVLFYFLGITKKQKGKKKHLMNIRRFIAVLLTLCMMAGSVYIAFVSNKVRKTVQKVTNTEDVIVAMMGVYVLSEDPAKSIDDVKDYTFAVMSDYDTGNTEYAVKHLEEKFGKALTKTSGATITDAAGLLYGREAGALIVNQAYAQVLPDTAEFKDFESFTRLLYEIPVTVKSDVSPTPVVVDNVPADEVNATPTPEPGRTVTNDPFVLYISGSDTRSKLLDKARSDVNILMIVNPKTKQILLLNTPRDYYVANTAGGGKMDKLTHCGIYGIDCSMSTLSNLYGVSVDYYAQINFTGFKTLIDEIGGIEVESPANFKTGSYTYVKGMNEMDGEKALAFARERYAFGSGDNERGKNQMRVIKAVINKMTSNNSVVLKNFSGILDSLSGMFVTSLSADDINSLVKMQLDDKAKWEVFSFAVTGNGGMDYTYSMPRVKAYVMYQNETLVKQASGLVDKVMSGEKITEDDLKPGA